MKKVTLILCVLSCIGCRGDKKPVSHRIVQPEFQAIIDSSDVSGAILFYDLNKDIYHSNDFEWTHKGKLPASTFKIANSIIGLETGIIENANAIFKWDGNEKWLKVWEQDLVLKDAFQYSCVHCYQEIARDIGVQRMNNYLSKLDYGNFKVDSTNIEDFWLVGESRVSQMQQIDFLKRFYLNELPISNKTSETVKNIMFIEEGDDYKLSGKTGLSNANQIYNGWYIGYIETQNNTYFFATNLEPKEGFTLNTFIKKRIDLTKSAFKSINVLN